MVFATSMKTSPDARTPPPISTRFGSWYVVHTLPDHAGVSVKRRSLFTPCESILPFKYDTLASTCQRVRTRPLAPTVTPLTVWESAWLYTGGMAVASTVKITFLLTL